MVQEPAKVKMGGLCRMSTTVILLSLAAVLSSTTGTNSDSGPLDRDRLIDGLATDFEVDNTDGLMDNEEPKRAVFRSDLGKRDDEMKIRTLRALSRSRSFKTDLGKRRSSMFRSDLGRRSAGQWKTDDQDTLHDMERRRAMFRSDLGKRYPYSYSRRMFRTDLGKRPMFRHDLG